MNRWLLLGCLAAASFAQTYPMPGPRNAPSAAPAASPYTYTGLHTIKTAPATPPVTDPLDTTGHNFFVVAEFIYNVSATPTPTDSRGLTWTQCGTDVVDAGTPSRLGIWYASGAGGTGHTFTATGANYSSIAVSVYDRVGGAVTPCDQFAGAAGTGASLAPGSITPTINGALVVAGCMAFHGSGSNSYASPFTVIDSLYDPSNIWGTHAYFVQTTAAATNVPCTSAGSSILGAAQASFK